MRIVSLHKKLLLTTCLASVLLVLFISGYQLYLHQERQKQMVLEEFEQFERGAKQAIREAVWLYDWDMVRTIITNQTSQIISYVEICDRKAAKCLQLGERNKAPFIEYQSAIVYQEPVRDQQLEIGSVYLQGNYSSMEKNIRDDLPGLLLSNSFGVFGIALLIFFLFHRQAIRRVVAIEDYTRRIDLQHIDTLKQLQIAKPAHPDEIDLLSTAVSELVEKVKDEFERRNLLEQQLLHAQKMEALGTLAGGMAHDFNNILAAIMGHAQLSYTASEAGSRVQGRQQQIISACERAKDLISQVLVFSRKSKADVVAMKLSQVVEEALKLIRASLPANIEIDTRLDDSVWVRGNSSQLHQVIMNLAANAGYVMKQDGGRLTVSVARCELSTERAALLGLGPGCYASLQFCDNGPGVPEEIQERIFDPFFSTKKVGEGTGMGLAVVHGIVQTHAGVIRMESRAGEGTCFSIYLPETGEQELPGEAGLAVSCGNGEHVMIVDDESDVASVGCDALQQLGYQVTMFTEPEAALGYFASGKTVDLLITDLTMPKISGIELAEKLRGSGHAFPILLWSGYSEEVSRELLEAGVINHLLHKPFRIEVLGEAVCRALEQA